MRAGAIKKLGVMPSARSRSDRGATFSFEGALKAPPPAALGGGLPPADQFDEFPATERRLPDAEFRPSWDGRAARWTAIKKLGVMPSARSRSDRGATFSFEGALKAPPPAALGGGLPPADQFDEFPATERRLPDAEFRPSWDGRAARWTAIKKRRVGSTSRRTGPGPASSGAGPGPPGRSAPAYEP